MNLQILNFRLRVSKVAIFFVSASLMGVGVMVFAISGDDIVYPVKELGNCGDEQQCKAYCEQPDNISACVDFAEEYNLMSSEEAETARRFADIASTGGPGGCRTKNTCETYCEDVTHFNECLVFAEQHDLMSPEELKEAKLVAAALRKGAQLPGGCNSKDDCDAYCKVPAHMEECFEFAVAAGLVPPDEIEEAKRVMPLMVRGETPGGCVSKEECEAYCGQESNFEECIEFAVKAGFMRPEEAEMARKTGGKGPGNCRSKDECEAFCNDPANQETCFNFAKEHGLIPEGELRNMEEGMTRLRDGLGQAPPEVQQCLQNAVGVEIVEKIKSGELTPGQQIGEQVKMCFEQFMPGPPEGEFEQNFPPAVKECIESRAGSAAFGGPLEEQNPELRDIFEQCFQEFGGEMGGIPPGGEFGGGGFVGPGGCSSEQECQQYCSDPSHQQECASFSGGEGTERGSYPEGGAGLCPAMPTVSECPAGQRREMVFSSTECGEYYVCVPDGTPPQEGEFREGMPPSGDFRHEDYQPPEGEAQDQYQQQYNQEFQQQYQEQYQQEYQRRYEEQYQQQYQQPGGEMPPPETEPIPTPEGSTSLLQQFLQWASATLVAPLLDLVK